MATEMEKDVLIEYVGGAIALLIKKDKSNQNIQYLKDLEDEIYATSHKDLDYEKIADDIKEMRKPYEY
ncbi:MAG: hypothetical protein WC144_01525 [Sulfurimonas sp.]|jgi:hypothetical protein|nr:hypothetical protein [Sulfurimonadaceae bacterium]